jgi:hypothetical protein
LVLVQQVSAQTLAALKTLTSAAMNLLQAQMQRHRLQAQEQHREQHHRQEAKRYKYYYDIA